MTSRDEILARVRRNQPALRDLPAVPTFDRTLASPSGTFKASLERMGGTFVDPPAGTDLERLIRKTFPGAKVICSATTEVAGDRPIDRVREPAALEDVDVGVVRARFGVAETGSVWLSEAELKINALGFLAQHLVVLLDPADIVANLHDAYRHHGFYEAGYATFLSGPSATADIEGVLIRGAQGIRSLTVVATPRAATTPSGPARP